MNGVESDLSRLAVLAREAGEESLAHEARALAERFGDGCFYVACVGQFKRGKSALINALIGQELLPTGVIPVTSVVTVVRHGAAVAARVRFGDSWEACDPRELGAFVTEEGNPGNRKGVSGVEVFVPSPVLLRGLCLVDTPGVGSVSALNTAATRAFLPRMDAALVVLGADPPISGEEADLIVEIARRVADVALVLNKADRLGAAERAEAVRFTARVVSERIGRGPGAIYEVSATERLAGRGPDRDWPALVHRLECLSRDAGADLVLSAARRGVGALRARLLRSLDEQLAALVRPIEATVARVAFVEQAVRDAETATDELAHRLAAARDRLEATFTAARDRFFASALIDAQVRLDAALRTIPVGWAARPRAMDAAVEIARLMVERWRAEQEPQAAVQFQEGFARFVGLVDELSHRLHHIPEIAEALEDVVDLGLPRRSGFHYTEMLTVAPVSTGARVLDLFRTGRRRAQARRREASAYLARLLEVNSARLKNDFLRRLDDGRVQLERAVRGRLNGLSASAARTLELARRAEARAAAGVAFEAQALARLRQEVERVGPLESASPALHGVEGSKIGTALGRKGKSATPEPAGLPESNPIRSPEEDTP